MPFYEYECSDCKFYVEALQKISDPPMKKCPSCKKQTLKRLVSAPVFRLKGGGWYETDFKSDQEKKRNLVGEDKDTSSESKSETNSETKSESAKSAKSEKASKPSAAKKAPAKSKSKPKAAKKK